MSLNLYQQFLSNWGDVREASDIRAKTLRWTDTTADVAGVILNSQTLAELERSGDRCVIEVGPGVYAIRVSAKPARRQSEGLIAVCCNTDQGASSAAAKRALVAFRSNFNAFALHEKNRSTIAGFCEKLERLYEEVNLIYRLAGIARIGGSVRERLESAFAEISATAPFKWATLCFSADSLRVHPELRGVVIRAGEPPVDAEKCKNLCERLIDGELEPAQSRILVGAAIPSGWDAASEILAEPISFDCHVVGVMLAGEKRGDDPELGSEDIQTMDALAAMLSAYHENAARYAEQESLFIGTIKALGHTLEAKDPYTRGHSERVAQLASQMARALGFSDETVDRYRVAGLVHDLGKIGIPGSILCKPGKLTREEFAQMQQHPVIGHRILKDITALDDVLPGVLHHHERWDGQGYPHRLAGENIPVIARVLALADSFDAMSSNRSYRSPLSRKQTLDEIDKCAGTQFDPALVPTFVGLDFSAFDTMLQSNPRNLAA